MDPYLENSKRFMWGPGLASLNPEKADLLRKFIAGRVLDLACGSGVYSDFIHNLGHEVTGVDNQPAFVKKAAKAYPDVSFQIGDANKLKFKADSFDTVVLFDILEHLDDEKTLKAISKIGRRLIISVPRENQQTLVDHALSHAHYLDQTHLRVYSKDSLKKILKKTGLKVIYLEESLPIGLSGFLIDRLSQGNPVKRILLKIILKPFLPEPPLYSTIFAVAERS